MVKLSRGGEQGPREGPLARKLRLTGDLSHPERFKLLLGLLVEKRSDEEIHEVYRHAHNYDRGRTQFFIDHARSNYQSHLRPPATTPGLGGSSADANPDELSPSTQGRFIKLPGGVGSDIDLHPL